MGHITLLGAGVAGGEAPEFDPADLFVGKEGIWLDFTDTSTLWQTITGTTAVASNGDPIGQVDDKAAQSSLNAPMRAVANDGTRPTFVTGGGAQFLATLSYMRAALTDRYTGTTAYGWLVCSVNSSSQSGARIVVFNDGDFDSDDYSSGDIGSLFVRTGSDLLAIRNGSKSTRPWTSDVRAIFESKFDGTNHTMYKDTTGGTPVSSSGAWDANLFQIGSLDSGAFATVNFQGVIYEIGVVLGAVPDAGDITDLQAYLAAKYP